MTDAHWVEFTAHTTVERLLAEIETHNVRAQVIETIVETRKVTMVVDTRALALLIDRVPFEKVVLRSSRSLTSQPSAET